jgi:hypothetical protein
MMIRANEIIARSEKILRLRRGKLHSDGNIDRTFELSRICEKFGKKWYARGHCFTEYEYGARK